MIDICIAFGKLVREYLLDDSQELDDTLSRVSEGTRGERIEEGYSGQGILQFNSPDFFPDLEECSDSLKTLAKKFRTQILLMITRLEKLTKKHSGKIILNYML